MIIYKNKNKYILVNNYSTNDSIKGIELYPNFGKLILRYTYPSSYVKVESDFNFNVKEINLESDFLVSMPVTKCLFIKSNNTNGVIKIDLFNNKIHAITNSVFNRIKKSSLLSTNVNIISRPKIKTKNNIENILNIF